MCITNRYSLSVERIPIESRKTKTKFIMTSIQEIQLFSGSSFLDCWSAETKYGSGCEIHILSSDILVSTVLFASLSWQGLGTRNEGLWGHGISSPRF